MYLVSRTHAGGANKAVTFDKESGSAANHLGLYISPQLQTLAVLNKPITVSSSSEEDCWTAASNEVNAIGGYSLSDSAVFPPHYWNGYRWVTGGPNFTFAFPVLVNGAPVSVPNQFNSKVLATDLLIVVAG
jgi:hypothetical protein